MKKLLFLVLFMFSISSVLSYTGVRLELLYNAKKNYTISSSFRIDSTSIGIIGANRPSLLGVYTEKCQNNNITGNFWLRLAYRYGAGYLFDKNSFCMILGGNISLCYSWFEVIGSYLSVTYMNDWHLKYNDTYYIGIAVLGNIFD